MIEAHYLFGVDYDNIDVVIHPQSIIHSMIETADSSVLAQVGTCSHCKPLTRKHAFSAVRKAYHYLTPCSWAGPAARL